MKTSSNPPFSKFCPPPPPPHFPATCNPHLPIALSVVLLLWLNEWLHHIWCAILLNYIMDLHISRLGTSVPERPWCVFYETRHQVYRGLTHNVFFCWHSYLIPLTHSLTHTHTHIHTHTHAHAHTHRAHSGASILTHPYKYIFLPPAMCSQQLSLLHWCLFFQKLFTCKSNISVG